MTSQGHLGRKSDQPDPARYPGLPCADPSSCPLWLTQPCTTRAATGMLKGTFWDLIQVLWNEKGGYRSIASKPPSDSHSQIHSPSLGPRGNRVGLVLAGPHLAAIDTYLGKPRQGYLAVWSSGTCSSLPKEHMKSRFHVPTVRHESGPPEVLLPFAVRRWKLRVA